MVSAVLTPLARTTWTRTAPPVCILADTAASFTRNSLFRSEKTPISEVFGSSTAIVTRSRDIPDVCRKLNKRRASLIWLKISVEGRAVATERSDASAAAGEDGPDISVVRLSCSDWAGTAVAPSRHTIIAKRKIKLFLIDFQLSVI